MKIKSITDVITNSSDETYVFKTDYDPDMLVKELRELLGPDHPHTGMGGILEAWSPGRGGHLTYGDSWKELPEGYMVVCIDNGYIHDTIELLEGVLGKPLEDKELDILFAPIYLKRYQELSEKFREESDGYRKYSYWCSWAYYREITRSTDKGFGRALKRVKGYLMNRRSSEKDKYDRGLLERSIEKINKQIEYENEN